LRCELKVAGSCSSMPLGCWAFGLLEVVEVLVLAVLLVDLLGVGVGFA